MTDGNTLLGDEELEMLSILRVNKEFMNYMHDKSSTAERLSTQIQRSRPTYFDTDSDPPNTAMTVGKL